MNALAEAYQNWRNHPVKTNDDCCSHSHFTLDDIGTLIPKIDAEVCGREKAWRNCVRLRDDNFKFPFKDGLFLQ